MHDPQRNPSVTASPSVRNWNLGAIAGVVEICEGLFLHRKTQKALVQSMLYIIFLPCLLFFSAHCSFAFAGVKFDASLDSHLPDNAVIFTHGPGSAVEVVDKKLMITPGSGGAGNRAAIALPSEGETSPDAAREIRMAFERPTNGGEVWTGFLTAQDGPETVFLNNGDWLGYVVELANAPGGAYGVILRESWEIDPTRSSRDASVAPTDFGRFELCTLDEFPSEIQITVENNVVRVSFTDAQIVKVVKGEYGSIGGSEVEKILQPEMVEILKGNQLDPAFGLANYGNLQDTPVWLINSFSVSP